MSKKLVKIGDKSYLIDVDTKELEEVEVVEEETPEVEEETEEETPEVEEETEDEKADVTDEAIKKIATEVVANLGIDKLTKSVDDLQKAAAKGKNTDDKKISALLDLETLMKKSVSEMTVEEKVVGFYQAMIQNNEAVLKALSEGVNADGGYLFPDEFRAEIIRDLADGNFMRNHVTVIPMKRDVMNIPSLESRPQVTWTDENAAKSTTTAHFGQETLTVYKMAAILYASDELVEDSTEVDIVRFIIGLFSEVIGEEEDRVIWRGNGTTQPTGIATARAAGAIATRTATGGLASDEIINLTYDLPGKYHKNAKFYTHRFNIRDIRKLKDTTNQYLWQPSNQAGEPATLHGFPLIEANDLADDQIYFGDLKKTYWLGDRKRMTVKISQDTETAFNKDQTAIRVVSRIAGNVVLGAACRALNGI